MLPRLGLTFLLALFLCPPALRAQTTPIAALNDAEIAAPAHVAHVEGNVVLERDGKPENAPLNMPLLSGDRIKTLDGRVEILFGDASTLHLDSRSTLDVQSDDLARLIDGRLRLSIPGPSRTVAYRIDSPAGSVRISQAGEYRIALLRQRDPSSAAGGDEIQLELAVIRGSGEIFTDQGATAVGAGERAYASAGLMPSYTYAYNSANWDAFDRWSESRRDTRLGVSAQYLPAEVRTYSSTFDEYGDWQYQPTYGYVWYPRVASTWRPYYYGRWASYPRYGWTWIGADAFAWPTHHYGRWGFSSGVWFWIPGKHWGPAYVSWAYAPGYVSWCPLGFNNRAVIGFDIYRVGPGYYSPYRAWTAVAYTHFGHSYYVHQRAVNWNHWDRNTRWQAGRAAPSGRDIAVPRGTPVHWAGSRSAGVVSGTRANDTAFARTAPNRDGAGTPGRIGRSSGTAAPTGRDVAVPRAGIPPRYVNRGDEIIRSQTERPSSPAPRTDIAVSRTAPSGPARNVDVAPQSAVTPRAGRTSDFGRSDRAVPRGGDNRGSIASPAAPPTMPAIPTGARTDPRAAGRVESPVYQPRAESGGGTRDLYRVRPDSPVYQPAPRSGSEPTSPSGAREYGRPRGEAGVRSGGYAAPPSSAGPPPNSGFRQPPSPGAAPSRGADGDNRAVPRSAPGQSGGGSAGAQARPRGGRGGV
jgi:hypothetical protein